MNCPHSPGLRSITYPAARTAPAVTGVEVFWTTPGNSLMSGLGGLEPPTSPLSVLRSLVSERHSSRYRMRSGSTIPKLMLWRELQQDGDDVLQKCNKRWLVLGLRPKDHDSGMGFWRVCLDIREIQVQRHQHAIFRAATLGEHRIAGTREFLVGDRISFETCPTKDRHVFCWKILVDFELQALISSGKFTVPSRVNSAAYANAASISGVASRCGG